MLRFVLLAVLLGYVSAMKNPKCPFTIGKYPFDEQKFYGDWYLISATTFIEKELAKCGVFNYKPNKEENGQTSYRLTYKAMTTDKKPYELESVSVPFLGKEHASLGMGVWRKPGTDDWSSVSKQAIVATDYENYALFWNCKPIFDPKTQTFSKKMFAAVMSRKKTLSEETLKVLKNVLTSYDIKESELKMVDHTNC